jgi:hypothetical protein
MKKSEMRDLNKGLDDKNYDTKVSVTKTNYDGEYIWVYVLKIPLHFTMHCLDVVCCTGSFGSKMIPNQSVSPTCSCPTADDCI